VEHTRYSGLVPVGADDPTLNHAAGLAQAVELVHRLGLIRRLDAAINAVRPFKQRPAVTVPGSRWCRGSRRS